MLRKFKIVLHIGTEKTGTTTLQKMLLDNKEHLLKEGFYYYHGERLINGWDLAAACVPDNVNDDYLDSLGFTSPEGRLKFREELKEEFRNKIYGLPNNVHTIIISSEHFHSRLVEQNSVVFLKNWLSPYAQDFKIFCYLRRQVDLVTSFYSTELKGGSVRSLEQCARHMLRSDNHYCNYDIFLSKWEKVFSKDDIAVKRFDRSEMVGGDIVEDFMSGAKISPSCIKEKTQNINESITNLGQVLLREVNKFTRFSEVEEKQKKEIRKLIEKSFPGKGRQLPLDQAKKLQAIFDESNEKIRSRWFPERKALFDNDFPEDVNLDLLDHQESAIASLLTFIASHGKMLNNLSDYDEYVDVLKEASKVMEERSLQSSYKLMELAGTIRPSGPVIKQKLNEYKARLDENE